MSISRPDQDQFGLFAAALPTDGPGRLAAEGDLEALALLLAGQQVDCRAYGSHGTKYSI